MQGCISFEALLPRRCKRANSRTKESKGTIFFKALYANPDRLRGFLGAMSGLSAGAAHAMAAKFPWRDYNTFADVGAAQGMMPVILAQAHSHLRGTGFDLPPVRPVFEEFVASHGLSDRLRFQVGDFFTDALPKADVIIMGHILHDWNVDQKRRCSAKHWRPSPVAAQSSSTRRLSTTSAARTFSDFS